jgi:hypothetical protein
MQGIHLFLKFTLVTIVLIKQKTRLASQPVGLSVQLNII